MFGLFSVPLIFGNSRMLKWQQEASLNQRPGAQGGDSSAAVALMAARLMPATSFVWVLLSWVPISYSLP